MVYYFYNRYYDSDMKSGVESGFFISIAVFLIPLRKEIFMKQNYDFFRSYLGVVSREPVSITYLKEEDKFALYYPGPKLSTIGNRDSFNQQCFKFDYYDMIFSINKLRDEIWQNRSKFYKEKEKEGRGKLLADILSGMFGYRCNDCLIVIFDRFCISKTILDKCYTLRKKKGGVRKIELKMRGK